MSSIVADGPQLGLMASVNLMLLPLLVSVLSVAAVVLLAWLAVIMAKLHDAIPRSGQALNATGPRYRRAAL